MAENGKTTIQISLKTKGQLDQLGKKGDSYDAIVRRVLESLNKKPQ